ncbi:pilus assembly protein TadG-related protein [Hyphobacterium sp. HN65]|uniref:Pilus assembly protein TadG-related protein n=1 Tax=Hyphobacterium lacteum TaxID=3116575 RepID=A0ABU7LRJ9_9PROT|nr:pilus assembly protein TadG-related protein [Hyphobacterium sp. HN65]MEE2526542.1 pilus assembly protein TadG-related protein [Hyphobacterium sp. HN65]
MNIIQRLIRHTKGNVAMVASLAFPLIVTMGGGAIEFAARHNTEQELQEVLDGAVLAGVSYDGSQDERMGEALDFFEATRFRLDYEPTVSWAWDESGANPVLTATAASQRPTLFLGLAGIPSFNIEVTSAATTARTWGDACWMSMDEHEKHTIEMHDDVRIEAPNCLFYGNSDDLDDVVDLHSCTNVLNARMVQTVGGGHHAGVDHDHCDGPLTDNIPSGTFLNAYVIQDPFGHDIVNDALAEAADCDDPGSDAHHDAVRVRHGQGGFNGRMEPGTYCRGLTIETNAQLQPGTYYLFGDFNISGARVTGDDVTLVFAEDVIFDWTDATVILSAPTTGPHEGMAILGLNDSDDNIFDESLIDIEGVVYMPLAKLIWVNAASNSYNNMSQVQHDWTVWIVEGASWEGDGTVFINFPEGDINPGNRRHAGYPEELRNIVPESNSLSARLVR